MSDRTIKEIVALPKPVTFQEVGKSVLRVAAYARVSTSKDEQETSLKAQEDFYQKKIQENPDWSFVKVYADDGISGLSTSHRDGFNQMIEDCLAGRVDLVLSKSISRFARNTVDSVNTIRKLKEKGVGVYFEKENIWTLDSKGEFLLTIMSSLAQEESRSISENTQWGQRKRFEDGKVSVAYSRFMGYDKGPHKYEMVVNREQAVTVRRIYHMFLQGYTPHKIAQALTEEHIPTPTGKEKWNRSTVSSILSNEKYKGDALLQKQFTVDFLQKKCKKNDGELPQYYVHEDHEAIISPWLFDYVQDQRKVRLELPERYSGRTMLSSKIVCGVCGHLYQPRPWHATTYNDLVWQCENRVKKGQRCKGPNIYDHLLHYIIHDAARRVLYARSGEKAVENAVLLVVDDGKGESVRQWLEDFKNRDIWELQSDEDDLAIVLKRIRTMANGTLEIMWLDEEITTYQLPKYSPRKGIEYDGVTGGVDCD